MGVERLKLINISSQVSNLDNVLLKFIDIKNVHPVLASQIVDKVKGLTSFVTENPCQSILTELSEFEKKYNFDINVVENKEVIDNFSEMHEYMIETKKTLDSEFSRINELSAKQTEYVNVLEQLSHLEQFDVDFKDLFQLKYVNLRIGKLPNSSLEKIKYFNNKPFVFNIFSSDGYITWCMYLVSEEYKREVDNIFSSLFFERLFIPLFVTGTPKAAKENLELEIKKIKEEIDSYRNEINEVFESSINKLKVIKGELLYLNRLYEAKKYVVGMGDRFDISIFVETEDVEYVENIYKNSPDVDITISDADSDKRITPPSLIKGDFFSKPFKMFTEMYGVPGYNDIDPTLFVAITYSILFGIMFGDFGQGLVVFIGSLLLAIFKKNNIGKIGIRLGISSMIFGLIFGSFFGNEEILPELYMKMGIYKEGVFPFQVMHSSNNTILTLVFAVGIGVVLIIGSMIFNIVTLIKKKKWVEMICSQNGIAGLIFYTCIIVGASPMILNMMLPSMFDLKFNIFNTITLIFGVLVPILLVFMKEPFERMSLKEKPFFEGGVGGFIIGGLFEMIEVLLGYLSNTMSFLRVGGFVLSHAGMMLVVMTLNSMMGNAMGHVLVLVIGNAFVMALEGLVVCIQGLRLEFYEMFSRYYEGNGVAFSALN